MNNKKLYTLKEHDNYYFKRLILTYLQPSKWERAIQESTDVSKTDYNGILSYKHYPIINRTLDFDIFNLKNISLPINLQYRNNRRHTARFLTQQYLEELEKVIKLELPDISEEHLAIITSEVRKLQATNSLTIKEINFEILQTKYKRLFNEQQFSTIIKYPYIQDALVSLDDDELKCFEIAFHSYLERENLIIKTPEQSEWNYKMEEYIASLMSEQYRQVIFEISQLTSKEEQEKSYKLLGYILDKPNYYNIQSLDDLMNLERTKKDICRKIMLDEDISAYPLLDAMSKIERYRFVGLQHFGFYPSYELANMFDSTIDENIDGENLWILQTLQKLKQLYHISDEAQLKNRISISEIQPFVSEKKAFSTLLKLLIKTQIEKNLNNNLTEISQLPRMGENDRGKYHLTEYNGTIYDATDTNFSLIVASVSPYTNYKPKEIENYREYWGGNQLSDLASYSFICPRNLTIASLKTANLGFNQVSGLTYMCPFDLDSQLGEFTPKANNICFMSTERLADYQNLTELNSKRISPDYIPLIKCWGEITNFNEALQAAYDFSDSHVQIPIVFMDWDKIRYEQAIENIKLILEYQKNPDKSMLKQIAQNMIFYQQPDHEIYGYFLINHNYMLECLGINTDEFDNYVRELNINTLVSNINHHMDYLKEKNLEISLKDILGEEIYDR